MVKSMRERLAEKRAAAEVQGVSVSVVPRPVSTSAMTCITCGAPITSGARCAACQAMRMRTQMPVTQPKHAETAEIKPSGFSPDRIRALRTHHNMSQTDLGDELGVTGMTVSNWEAGRTNPSEEFVVAMTALEQKPPKNAQRIARGRPKKAEDAQKADADEVTTTSPATAQHETIDQTGPESTTAGPGPAVVENAPAPAKAESEINVNDLIANVLTVVRNRFVEVDAEIARVEARISERDTEAAEPIAPVSPEIRDNLDAFRLLVRTFGIDTADRVVDLLRG